LRNVIVGLHDAIDGRENAVDGLDGAIDGVDGAIEATQHPGDGAVDTIDRVQHAISAERSHCGRRLAPGP